MQQHKRLTLLDRDETKETTTNRGSHNPNNPNNTNSATMSANGEEFKDVSELKVWLEGKGVRKKVASTTASTLFKKGFDTPSTLLGISSEQLERSGLSIPFANELSNALKQVSLNLCLWCFICCVRDLTVSPLFSLWVEEAADFLVSCSGHGRTRKKHWGSAPQANAACH